ncbi:MAG: bifunctional (p)ppGpp synthetase/guanosine-3',5'-bis(diphosphate) 3'-pyrophosphohydrolase [Candidatus Eisenbacteria bacterium]|nr:bifunctional (p)ppGpp synthetase/guanosine-3',5'-bis(diphosphate) 3'-pyrophosphohydrolase [Candidatus Eisenbacteria bacterium]
MKTHLESVEELRAALLADLSRLAPEVDSAFVERAIDFAEKAHEGQRRASGAPYVSHPLQVTRILIDLLRRRADAEILASALLHDVVEDIQHIRVADVEAEFGPVVARLVDGVTKIGGLRFPDAEVEQSENFRKMLLSMAQDIRVILIKLADRLHNMRTLDFLRDAQKRERIARETKEIYAPLAHRLGIARFKWELEDLAFKHLNPEAYRTIAAMVAEKRREREDAIEEVLAPLAGRLKEEGIPAEIQGRAKNFASIWEKMQRQNARFEEIYDLLGIRVITEKRIDCYRVLGIVHDMFIPVHDRFKDYIATPKSNMYQSLHTTVMAPPNRMVEIQIRTREMHLTSEIGIAAHYRYKEGGRKDGELERKLGDLLLRRPVDLDTDEADPREFLDILKVSLYQDEVFVFTPKGELKQLPRGSTPLDFAYAIHSEVGNRCVGARVNGRLVALRYELQSGDTVEVLTSPSARPNQDWLGLVRTGRARSKIRQWLKQQRLADSVALGREMLARELRRRRKRIPGEADLDDIAQSFGQFDASGLLANIGQGDISPVQVVARLYPEPFAPQPPGLSAAARLKQLARPPIRGIKIQGVGNVMIQFAHCCEPVPGDPIVGLITRGRGISVHQQTCPNILDSKIEKERVLDLQWDVEGEPLFPVRLEVSGDDRQNLLAEVSAAISKTKTNIREGSMQSVDSEARGHFIVEVRNRRQLNEVIRAVRAVRGVQTVERKNEIGGNGSPLEELP